MATVVQFTISKDNKKWAFKMSKGIYYCNGKPISEADYNRNLTAFKAGL